MEKSTYPISIFCIIATEFCERFSFCGLRTILSLYLRNELLLPETSATVVYHVFIMVCYVIPIVGAICADSILGRYRTILYFSVVYLVGNMLMCLAAVPIVEASPILFTVVGLALIAVGTGGIKPCVAAFGGDQFHLPKQKVLLQQFFSIFYFSINLGGFVGMVLTPIMRKSVTCFGDETCYALGFGFPALLMLLSLLLFILGKQWYRQKKPKENIMVKFLHCAIYAMSKKMKRKKKEPKKDHWLDYSKGKYQMKLIYDMKIVFAVLLLYAPLPIFWSLFDQQGSRWTFQASRMDGNFWGMQIVPDQMQVINPALVLILIPIFDRIFYPFLTKLNILENPLHRMAIGGLIAGLAFLSAGVLELLLERSYPQLPDKHQASLNIINTLPCDIDLYNPFNHIQKMNSSEVMRFRDVYASNFSDYKIRIEAPEECDDLLFDRPTFETQITAMEYQTDTIIIGIDGDNDIAIYITDPVDFKSSLSGKPRLRVAYIKTSKLLHNVSVSVENAAGLIDIYFIPEHSPGNMSVSAYMELPSRIYEYTVQCMESGRICEDFIYIAQGGVYTLVLRERNGEIEFSKMFTMSPPNSVHIMWLIPQYFLISVAEIMFGIAGLEFSFTQAPKSMKTVTIAAWYLSVALGNFLVIIITQAKLFKSQAYEFFLFAVLIVADMMLFTQMASEYRFVQLEADSSALMLGEETPLLPSAPMLEAAPQ